MSQIHLGIIGMGYAGQQHFAASVAIDGLEAVAVADPRKPAGVPPGVRMFESWRELIKSAGVDAVSICLPHHLHQEVSLAAIAAGKHVLLEKPIACTLDEAAQIVEAARRAKVTLVVELTHRFYEPVREARAAIARGVLGRLIAVEDRIIENIPEEFPAWILSKAEAGGGVALTNGVHMLDRIAFVTGQRPAFTGGHAGYTQGLGDIEDTAAMLLRLDDGTPAQLLASWRRGAATRMDDELTIYGTRGTIRVYAWRGWKFEPVEGVTEEHVCYPEEWSTAGAALSAMTAAMREFTAAVNGRAGVHPLAEAALASQALIHTFYRHAAEQNG